MSIAITTSEGVGATRVACAGEVDVSNASELRDALNQALEGAPQTLEVDLSEVSYIDSTGIGVLVGVAHHAKDESVAFKVLRPQRNVDRIMSILGVDSELGVER